MSTTPELPMSCIKRPVREEFPLTATRLQRRHGWRMRYAPAADYVSPNGRVRRWRKEPDLDALVIHLLVKRAGCSWSGLEIAHEDKHREPRPGVRVLLSGKRDWLLAVVREFTQCYAAIPAGKELQWFARRAAQ